jgi:putative inorganic carbon (HCO3(-)) transporter
VNVFEARNWGKALSHRNLLPAIASAIILVALGLALAWLPLELAAALAGGAIAFFAILIRPTWGLYLLIFAVPFGGLREVQLGPVTVGLLEISLGLVLIAWLAGMAARRSIEIPHPPLTWPFLIYLGAGLLSLLVTLSLGYSLKELLKWGEMLALYLFVVSAVRRDERQLRALVVCILLAGMAEALFGFYQFFFRAGPEGFLLFDGRFMRAYGTFAQPNPYGGYLGLVLPLAYSLLVGVLAFSPGGRPFWRLAPDAFFYVVVTISLAAALAMSMSRGAMLSAAAALAVVSAIRSRRAAAFFTLLVFLLAVFLLLGQFQLLPPGVTQRFAGITSFLDIPDVRGVEVTDENFAVLERLAHWQAAWEMWAEHPWLGVGVGNYVPVYPAYALPYWEDPLGHAHNYYLNVAAETGLVGLTAYLLLWGWVFAVAWRTVRGTAGYRQSIAVGIFGVLVHLSAHNFFDNLYVQGMYLHVALLLGLLCLLPEIATCGRVRRI